MNQRKTGINGKNIIVSARVVPPSPSQEEWEACFNCNFDESPVGYRPDTIFLSNLPINWFQLDHTTRIHSSSELFKYMSQFGEVRYEFWVFLNSEMRRIDKDPLFATIGIVFNSYEGFCNAITTLRNRVIIKPNVKKEFLLGVAFDTTHFFSKQSKRERR